MKFLIIFENPITDQRFGTQVDIDEASILDALEAEGVDGVGRCLADKGFWSAIGNLNISAVAVEDFPMSRINLDKYF